MQERKKMLLIAEHEKWVEIAKDDLGTAQDILFLGRVRGTFYHSQQAAEKALKGYLVFRQQEIKKTHDLTGLLELCLKFDTDFGALREATKRINPYSTKFRYPSEYDQLDQSDAVLAIKHAKNILKFVLKKIKESETGQKNILE